MPTHLDLEVMQAKHQLAQLKLTEELVNRDTPPTRVQQLWFDQKISQEQLRRWLTLWWWRVKPGNYALPREQWIELFRAAGYAVNGEAAVPPERVTLFRGAGEDDRWGWWWTEDPRVAMDYRCRVWGRSVWITQAPGSALLAHRNKSKDKVVSPLSPRRLDQHHQLNEYIVDTSELKILRTTL
ncbi:hypothetical protein PP564_13975 [Mycobacteroides abscessus]|uniref:hypothetical protein n=1 Tax=Mycobacteroides abscessus TaxID=36809 RepID=UPI000C25A17E|nr:hypothetical protein [Mycobacteroides abscessus]MDM2493482.1 hypothetical protein [Mycobacteroides abscessus]MDM2514428.1 hypothetical protein [Mycobacteroides abscessus]MDM2523784.1 hypothetical protein [Mycobacteroides abscessus]MDM2528207.1 hypothetical protein [Mycobacteroides abscessus]MDM2531558.1 hypothetical protein [Mycobacteroides abscessus]